MPTEECGQPGLSRMLHDGRILAETWKADDAMVVAGLDASLLEHSTGSQWIRTRRPELYGPLTVPTGKESGTRSVRFDEVGG